MLADDDHVQLLNTVLAMGNTNIMISTRENELYNRMLASWRKEKLTIRDRAGTTEEIIFMNYPQPEYLHQYNHLGTDCWERQKLKRQVINMARKMAALPPYQRHAILSQLLQQFSYEIKKLS